MIGLTGAIGAGKSRVARMLADRGAMVLDADAIGHALLDQRPAREEVVKRFGKQLLESSGTPGQPPRVNRLLLGALVFADGRALRDLEAILHPRMRRTFERAISRAARSASVPAVVIDAAVLLEAGWNNLCDAVVFVDAARPTRLERLKTQRGWSAEKLDSRERAQLAVEEKRRRADHIITNESDPEALRRSADNLWNLCVATPAGAALPARPRSASGRAASPRGSPP